MARFFGTDKGKEFFRSVGVLSLGAVFAQLVNFLCSVGMARLFSQADIGYFSYLLSVSALFYAVINARMDIAILKEPDERTVRVLVRLSHLICAALSVLVTAGSLVYVYFARPEERESLWAVLLILPLLLLVGCVNIGNAEANRLGAYRRIGLSGVLRAVLQFGVTVGAGLAFPALGILLAGQLIGQGGCAAVLLAPLAPRSAVRERFTKEDYLSVLKKYRHLPRYSVPASFLNAAAFSVVGLVFGQLFGMEAMALYAVCTKALGVQINVFGASIGKVHVRDAQREIGEGGCAARATAKMLTAAFALGVPVCLFFMILSPPLFAFVFGEGYREAGAFARLLAPMFLFRMATDSIGHAFFLADRQRIEELFQGALLAGAVLCGIAARLFSWDSAAFLVCLCAVFSAIYAAELTVMIRLMRRPCAPVEGECER